MSVVPSNRRPGAIMRRAARLVVLGLGMLPLLPGPARIRAAPDLVRTDAFETSYVTSFYSLDACGDELSGRLYRQALVERFDSCPFSADARARFRQHSRAERTKATAAIRALISEHGGLPMQLQGMSATCHAQHADPAYQAFRDRLGQYGQGSLPVAGVVPQPCDAASITP